MTNNRKSVSFEALEKKSKPRFQFFPYPFFYNSKFYDGFTIKWPTKCRECKIMFCVNTCPTALSLCPLGYNFIWVSNDVLIGGVIVRDFPKTSSAQKKALRNTRQNQISSNDLNRVSDIFSNDKFILDDYIQIEKEQILRNYQKSEQYKEDFLKSVIPEIEKAFSTLHDYRQFVGQVIQNVNVFVEQSIIGNDFEEKLSNSDHPIKAIYYASRMMEQKLASSLFMKYPERITQNRRYIKIHGLTSKIIKIYQMAFEKRNININLNGSSIGYVLANPDAISIIPHTFIDNALKYAPKNSSVDILFEETSTEIKVTVTSFGPLIESAEKARIFDMFFRSEAAKAHTEEGSGFGLFSAKYISEQIGSRISFLQLNNRSMDGLYLTSFSAVFNRNR